MSTSKLIHGITRIFLAEALLVPTGFATAVFLARELKPAGYGLFALITQFVIWVEYLLVSGLQNTTIKFVSGSDEKKAVINTVYVLYFGLGVTIGAIIYILSPYIAGLVKTAEASLLLRLLSLDIPLFTMAHAGRHILVGLSQLNKNAVMRSSYWISRLIFIVFFVSIGMSIKGAVIGLLCASTVEICLGMFFTKPTLLSGRYVNPIPFLEFLAPLHLSEFYKRIIRQELFVLRALGGTAISTGLYGAAKNMAIVPALLSRSINPSLLSTLNIRIMNGNLEEARELALTSFRAFFWFLPMAALLAGSSREIIRLIYGSEYIGASTVFQLLIFAGLGIFMINSGIVIFTAWSKPRFSISVTWPMVPIAAVGYFICFPRWNYVGIAIATLCAITFGVLRTFYICHREWRLFPPTWTILRSLGGAFIISTLAIIWPTSGLSVIIKLAFLSLFIVLWFLGLGEFSIKERNFIQGLLKKTYSFPPKNRD